MKILLHVHTSSDGKINCRELAHAAEKLGFGAVFITEHMESLDHQKYASLILECSEIKNCLLIPGYERDWEGFHILAINQYELQTQKDLANWAQAVRNNGGLVILAHPSRYAFKVPERILAHCDGVEIWNSKRYYDGIVGPDPCALKLVKGECLAFCGQDAHVIGDIRKIGITIDDGVKGVPEIIDRLRSGRYRLQNAYLSYTPTLKVSWPLLWVFHYFRRPLIKLAVRTKGKLRQWLKS